MRPGINQKNYEKMFLYPVTMLIITGMVFTSCTPDYVPKPRGYFRIELPEKKYFLFEPTQCPFSFEAPAYAELIPDTNSLAEPCWWYMRFPQFGGEVFLSYKPVSGNVREYIEDAYTLAYKHTVKADEISETRISGHENIHGTLYYIGGNAASSVQFFLTDSIHHFLRGALYFNAVPNSDSISPVSDFIKADINHLIESFTWRNNRNHQE